MKTDCDLVRDRLLLILQLFPEPGHNPPVSGLCLSFVLSRKAIDFPAIARLIAMRACSAFIWLVGYSISPHQAAGFPVCSGRLSTSPTIHVREPSRVAVPLAWESAVSWGSFSHTTEISLVNRETRPRPVSRDRFVVSKCRTTPERACHRIGVACLFTHDTLLRVTRRRTSYKPNMQRDGPFLPE